MVLPSAHPGPVLTTPRGCFPMLLGLIQCALTTDDQQDSATWRLGEVHTFRCHARWGSSICVSTKSSSWTVATKPPGLYHGSTVRSKACRPFLWAEPACWAAGSHRSSPGPLLTSSMQQVSSARPPPRTLRRLPRAPSSPCAPRLRSPVHAPRSFPGTLGLARPLRSNGTRRAGGEGACARRETLPEAVALVLLGCGSDGWTF